MCDHAFIENNYINFKLCSSSSTKLTEKQFDYSLTIVYLFLVVVTF